MRPNDDAGRDRKRLNFANAVSAKFGFLQDLGFSKIESLPTLVRYRNGEIEVSVYHGRNSYEVGFEIANGGTRYSMSELIRATDPAAADKYRNFAATTPVGIEKALTHLEKLAERHAQRALQSDPEFLAALQSQRKSFAQSYALDVLAGQLRPKAAAAFRSGDYREAALLYEKIRSRLSAAELKKLALAKERAGF